MSPTDTSEKMLESIIVRSLVDDASYIQGDSRDYDRDHAVDKKKLLEFLHSSQPKDPAAGWGDSGRQTGGAGGIAGCTATARTAGAYRVFRQLQLPGSIPRVGYGIF